MRNIFGPSVALLLLAIFIGETAAQAPRSQTNPQLETIRAELVARAADGSLPSVSVGVIRNGSELWKESFGYADVERKIAATPDTIYALGSLSKSMTGTAVFKLVQNGKLDLDHPINKYLRTATINFHGRDPDRYKVFHLLNMAAGLPHYWRYCYRDAGNLGRCESELLDRASFSAFGPGEVHLYSNLSFGLAARMVADVARKPFADFMQTEIFGPAGMNGTLTHIREIPENGLIVARPYKTDGNPASPFQFEPAGGGGFFSNVNDLLKYGKIHLPKRDTERQILSNATLAENHRVRSELPHQYYANGWGVLPLPGNGKTLLSNGAIEGAAATLLVLPDAEIVIVVLVNKTVGNDFTDDIAFRIAGAVLPGYKRDLDALFSKIGPTFSEEQFTGENNADGTWVGKADIGNRKMSLRINIRGPAISLALGNRAMQKLSDVKRSGGLIRGDLELDRSLQPEVQSKTVTVTFRISNDKLTGFVQDEVLSPRPTRMLSYFISASRSK